MAFEEFRINGRGFRLREHDPAYTGEFKSKKDGRERLDEGVQRLRELQEILHAQDRYALLLIFQAMDAAGKDSTIDHVMSGVNPMGCQVFSFKAPSDEELDHDFLWRTTCRLPERGRIGIFNRSYYEEVLVVCVHPAILKRQKLPPELVTPNIWKERFEDIVAFERFLTRNGVVVRKFFLNVSKEEQRQRFLARLEEPQKNWKFAVKDVEEREHWDRYMAAYEDCIAATSTPQAPWYVIPADHKWFTRMAVAEIIVETLKELKVELPILDDERRAELVEARKILEAQSAGLDERPEKEEKD